MHGAGGRGAWPGALQHGTPLGRCGEEEGMLGQEGGGGLSGECREGRTDAWAKTGVGTTRVGTQRA